MTLTVISQHSLSTLMLADVQDILMIITPHDAQHFERLLGNGPQFGVTRSYGAQPFP